MIYTAEEFGSADIMGEMERKLERLNHIVAAYCCSQNEPTMEDVTAIADYLDVVQEQFHECELSLAGSLKVGKMIQTPYRKSLIGHIVQDMGLYLCITERA